MNASNRATYAEHIRLELLSAGRVPVAATMDAAGNCTTCGEAGRCPGYHAADEESAEDYAARVHVDPLHDEDEAPRGRRIERSFLTRFEAEAFVEGVELANDSALSVVATHGPSASGRYTVELLDTDAEPHPEDEPAPDEAPTGPFEWGESTAPTLEGIAEEIEGFCVNEIDNVRAPIVDAHGNTYGVAITARVYRIAEAGPDA